MNRRVLALALGTLLPSVAVVHAGPDPVVDAQYACKQPAPGAKLRVSLAPETSLFDLSVWVSSFTCKSVIFGRDVAKYATRVTVISPAELTSRQALQLFVDSIEATGLVVIQKGDSLIIKLGPNMPKGCPDSQASSTGSLPTLPLPEVGAKVGDAEADLAAILAGIRTIDATHREIKRAALDKLLDNPMLLASAARVVPTVRDGKPIGFKVYAIRADSVYGRLGLVNGDTLRSINGRELTSTDAMLDAYTRLHGATRLELVLERSGKPITLVTTIRD